MSPFPTRACDLSLLKWAVERVFVRLAVFDFPAKLAHTLRQQRQLLLVRHHITHPAFTAQHPLRIAFATDLHCGPSTHHSLIARTCQMLTELSADICLLGGDYVLGDAKRLWEWVPTLAQIPARLGKFAVLGNHDLWADETEVRNALHAAGFVVLCNASQALPAPFTGIVVGGMDVPTSAQPDFARTFPLAGGFRIVLMHSPEGLHALSGQEWHLALAGHTHAGQIALPNYRPILLPAGKYNRKYPYGCFHLQNAKLIVSSGVGYAALPIRWNAPSEVVEIVVSA